MRTAWIALLALTACNGADDKGIIDDDGEGDADTDADTDADADADADTDADTDTGPVAAICPETDFVGTPRTIAGDSSTLTDDWSGSCGGAGGADYTGRFEASGRGRYVFRVLGAAFDGVLYVTETCGGAELGCDDSAGEDTVVLDLLDAQEVIVTLDGASAAESGPFTVSAVRVPSFEEDCGDAFDDDYDGDEDCDDPDCLGDRECQVIETADTGDSRYFEVANVNVSAAFGYDAALAALVSVTTPYGTIDPNLTLDIGDPDWEAAGFDPGLTSMYCQIVLPLTDPTFAAWAVGNPTIWYGVEYDPAAVPLSTCTAADGFDIDPAFLAGSPDLATALTSYGAWGVAVGDLSASAAGALAGYAYGAIPVGTFAGGWVEDGLLGYEVDQVLSWVEEIDAGYNTLGTYVPAASIQAAPVVTGFYVIDALYYITFA